MLMKCTNTILNCFSYFSHDIFIAAVLFIDANILTALADNFELPLDCIHSFSIFFMNSLFSTFDIRESSYLGINYSVIVQNFFNDSKLL